MLSEQIAVVASFDVEADVDGALVVSDGADSVEEMTAEVGERLTEATPASTVK